MGKGNGNVFIDPITHTPMSGHFKVDKPKGRVGTGAGRNYTPPTAKPVAAKTPQQLEAIAYRQALAEAAAGKPPKGNTPSITDMQKFLKGKGYAIKVDGQLGPQTKSALKDWHSGKAKRDPKSWSAAQGVTPSGNKSGNGGSTSENGKGNGGGTTSSRSTSSATNVNIAPPHGQQMDPNDWNQLQTYDPKMADAMAGQEFDPQIQMAKLQQARQPKDAAQAIHDITKWYGDVGTSLGTAQTRNAATASTATNQVADATRAILSSLGGAANSGANMIAGQGDANAAAQAQMGQAEQQYQSDLAPLLKDEAAGQLTSQRNTNTKNQQDMAAALSGLLGQRGQAKTNALMQILQANNGVIGQRLQGQAGATQYNNSLGQQDFQNHTTLEELRQAAALNNANVKYYTAAAGQSSGQGFTPWGKANASQRQQLINAAMGSITDANGAVLPQYAKNPHGAWIAARQYLRGQGYNSAFKKTASDMGAYQNITDLIQGGLNRAYGIYNQRAALVNGQ